MGGVKRAPPRLQARSHDGAPVVVVGGDLKQEADGNCIAQTVIGNPIANCNAPQISYNPSGYKVTRSMNHVRAEDGLVGEYDAFTDIEKRQDWQAMLTLATKLRATTPQWFTLDAFSGEANLHLCNKETALFWTEKFMKETKDLDEEWARDRGLAEQDLATLTKPGFPALCRSGPQ